MDFETFKQKYAEKLVSTGFFENIEDALNDEHFNDRMAEIYLGLMVYSEYQNEQAKAQYEQMKKQQQEQQNKPKIHLPNKGMH